MVESIVNIHDDLQIINSHPEFFQFKAAGINILVKAGRVATFKQIEDLSYINNSICLLGINFWEVVKLGYDQIYGAVAKIRFYNERINLELQNSTEPISITPSASITINQEELPEEINYGTQTLFIIPQWYDFRENDSKLIALVIEELVHKKKSERKLDPNGRGGGDSTAMRIYHPKDFRIIPLFDYIQ
ncbi:MAG TPA: hypothetical protein VGA67_02970 [Candidatus Dojkabacteria bacterium]|jgi:hypothetical protein